LCAFWRSVFDVAAEGLAFLALVGDFFSALLIGANALATHGERRTLLLVS